MPGSDTQSQCQFQPVADFIHIGGVIVASLILNREFDKDNSFRQLVRSTH